MLGLGTGASQSAIVDELCGDASGQTAFIGDAFLDGNTPSAFSAAISWTKLLPTPEATNPGTGDGLSLNALITVGPDGDSVTDGNLDLGTNSAIDEEGEPTVETVWASNDEITYRWTDVDAFDSEPAE